MSNERPYDERPAARPSAESEARARHEAADRQAAAHEETRKRRRGCLWIAGGTILGGLALGILPAIMSPKASEPQWTTVPAPVISQECMRAMNAAEDTSGNNDDAMIITLSACDSAQEWIDALKLHPGAGSLVSYTDDDAREYLSRACALAPNAAACNA